MESVLYLFYPKDLGPSNGRGPEPVFCRVRVLKIASFEGPMILRVHSKVILFPDCFSLSLSLCFLSHGDLREEVGRVWVAQVTETNPPWFEKTRSSNPDLIRI